WPTPKTVAFIRRRPRSARAYRARAFATSKAGTSGSLIVAQGSVERLFQPCRDRQTVFGGGGNNAVAQLRRHAFEPAVIARTVTAAAPTGNWCVEVQPRRAFAHLERDDVERAVEHPADGDVSRPGR